MCACSAITGLNDFSTGACVGACADASPVSIVASGDGSSGYDPTADAVSPVGDDAGGDDATSTPAGGDSGGAAEEAAPGGSSSGGGSGSSSGVAATCVVSKCPATCIPVYQAPCCKATGGCGCMVAIPPGTCK